MLLNYSYNVLMSVEGSVLFTEGDNTTLPLIALQDVWKVRPDVTILNLDIDLFFSCQRFPKSNQPHKPWLEFDNPL